MRRTPHGVRGLKFPRVRPWRVYTSSHPSRGAWIEIFGWGCCRRCLWSHPSRGAWIEITLLGCGSSMVVWSHPSRGAWIEIYLDYGRCPRCGRSHPSRGAWIEIFLEVISWHYMASRTPHGVRGLKYTDTFPTIVRQRSHPSRGAWIEIYTGAGTSCRHPSHPSRGAWIEIQAHHMQAALRQSHPSRGAWIEIHPNFGNHRTLRGRTPHGVRGLKLIVALSCVGGQSVAPLTGCVD